MMLALSEADVARLFGLLDHQEVMEISQAMAVIGRVESRVVEELLHEFNDRLARNGGVVGGFDATEKLLLRALDPNRAEAIMQEIRGPIGRTVWDKLAHVNEAVLASYLKNEYPQTIAVVLSKVRSDHAARVLAALPEEAAIETVLRMLRMEMVQKEILNEVEETLRVEFMTNLARTDRRDNHEIMAEIFNSLDRSTETRFLELLEERNKESADRVRALMFTFEDLAKIDGPGIQTLLRNVDNSKLGLALKGASETLRELFFTNMSERASKILRADMENMGPVRLRDVEEAQMMLVNAAKDLAAAGEIFIADGKEDELLA
jgi:flagellar motor switch protein FliG